MVDFASLWTIVAMAAVTYLTRTLGFVVLRNRTLSLRAQAVMEAAPGCVLIAVIAPSFVSDRPSELLALAITVVAASRLSMLPTVLIGIAASGILRHVLP